MAEKSAPAESSTAAVAEGQPLMADRKKMKILVPVDDSDASFNALRWALDHLFGDYPVSADPALEQDPNTITLLNVQPNYQPIIYPPGPGLMIYPTHVAESVKKAQKELAAAILSRALNICKEKKIKAETLILEGDPKDRICEAADQLHVDLIVIGSRGLGAVKRALLGSVSNYCAHHAHSPVLIVKPPAKQAHD